MNNPLPSIVILLVVSNMFLFLISWELRDIRSILEKMEKRKDIVFRGP